MLGLSATWSREVWSSLTASNAFERLSAPLRNHLGFTMGGRLELLDHAAFRWVNTMLGNIKTRFTGAAISSQRHIPRHLAEYCFRFNNRFDLSGMLAKLRAAAAITPPMPYRLLEAG